MASREAKGSVPYLGWLFLAVRCMDPRYTAAITWEVEHNERWSTLMKWNRSPSRQGYSSAFRVMDVVERVQYDDAAWWNAVLMDPVSAYPRTVAAIETMAGADAAFFQQRLKEGISIGHKRHQELYAYQFEPKFLVLHLFCCGRSGSCMRAMAVVLSKYWAAFASAGFLPLQPGRDDDAMYAALLVSPKAETELLDFSSHWGLDNPQVLDDLVALSMNLEGSRAADNFTYEFAHGRALPSLFELFSFSLGALATTCVIAELLFSQMKNVQEANETSESVDEELMLIFNVLYDDRQLRREMLDHTNSGGGRHVHTREQIVKLCEQVLALLPRYAWEDMKSIGGRRTFQGLLEAKDRETAQRGTAVKNEKKASRKTTDFTDTEWAAAEAAVRAQQLSVQIEAATLEAITMRQRVFAVVMEEKTKGQINASAVFWNKIKGGKAAVLLEVRCVLPMISPFFKDTNLSLKDTEVKTVKTRGPRRILASGAWTAVAGSRPMSSAVKKEAQVVYGLLSTLESFRTAFFARESPWKPLTGSIEGAFTVNNSTKFGYACPYCKRKKTHTQGVLKGKTTEEKVVHWGSVACFLTLSERAEVGVLVLMNTHSSRTKAAGVAMSRMA